MSSTAAPPRGSAHRTGADHPSARGAAPAGGASSRVLPSWLARLDSPVTTYYVLMSATGVLVLIGLVMVLSASAISSYLETESSYTIFFSQLEFAGLGVLALLAASRMSVSFWKRAAVPSLVAAMALQLLVFTPLGQSVNGNTNWIGIGPLSVQPSEAAKVGLALSGAAVLAAKRRHLGRFWHVVVPYLVPLAGTAIALVLLGHDLGTVVVMAAIVGAVLFTAGVPTRWFALAGGLFGAVAAYFVISSTNRLGRIDVWLNRSVCQPTDEQLYYGICRQPMHSFYALADGGWWGVGLGASREKWQWLSEPHNDFIFAIIGEELGLPGTLVIIALFCVLVLACYRLVLRSTDLFVRLATAGIMCWIVVQAMVNIGAVIGLLPVIGVPLPLVSSGGSSLITTMLALGILLSFARQEPGCAEVLSARPAVVRASRAIVPMWRGRRR
jgi:cell division protein FtsW